MPDVPLPAHVQPEPTHVTEVLPVSSPGPPHQRYVLVPDDWPIGTQVTVTRHFSAEELVRQALHATGVNAFASIPQARDVIAALRARGATLRITRPIPNDGG